MTLLLAAWGALRRRMKALPWLLGVLPFCSPGPGSRAADQWPRGTGSPSSVCVDRAYLRRRFDPAPNRFNIILPLPISVLAAMGCRPSYSAGTRNLGVCVAHLPAWLCWFCSNIASGRCPLCVLQLRLSTNACGRRRGSSRWPISYRPVRGQVLHDGADPSRTSNGGRTRVTSAGGRPRVCLRAFRCWPLPGKGHLRERTRRYLATVVAAGRGGRALCARSQGPHQRSGGGGLAAVVSASAPRTRMMKCWHIARSLWLDGTRLAQELHAGLGLVQLTVSADVERSSGLVEVSVLWARRSSGTRIGWLELALVGRPDSRFSPPSTLWWMAGRPLNGLPAR